MDEVSATDASILNGGRGHSRKFMTAKYIGVAQMERKKHNKQAQLRRYCWFKEKMLLRKSLRKQKVVLR